MDTYSSKKFVFRFTGSTEIPKMTLFGVELIRYEVDFINLKGICKVYGPNESRSIREVTCAFKDFSEMLLNHDWNNYEFFIRINISDKTISDLYKDLNAKFILEKIREREYSRIPTELIKGRDKQYRVAYVHISESKNICLFLGDPYSPDYSVVLLDSTMYSTAIRKLLKCLELKFTW